jgi:hypothetical protein
LLEGMEASLIHPARSAHTEYPDPGPDELQTRMPPALRRVPLSRLAKMNEMPRGALEEARAGCDRPRLKNGAPLASIVRKLGPG